MSATTFYYFGIGLFLFILICFLFVIKSDYENHLDIYYKEWFSVLQIFMYIILAFTSWAGVLLLVAAISQWFKYTKL
jgi:hypothetical protein